MSLVVRAQLRFLWRARGSMLSALLGMTIGTASVVGVHLLSAQIASRVAEQAQPLGSVDLYLQRTELGDADYFRLRARWRAGEFPQVAALFPVVEGRVSLEDNNYLLVGTDPLSLGALGSMGSAEGGLTGLAQLLSGDSVYLPASLRERFTGADPVPSIALANNPVGVVGFAAPEGIILADLPTARKITSAGGTRLTRIGVRLLATAKPASFASRLADLVRNLFPGVLAQPVSEPLAGLDANWQQITAANQDPTQNLLRAVLFNVAALSVLALVVAWLLTYQVACHALGRRVGMFERLQSMGVARARLRRLTQAEGFALGVAAMLLGAGLGLLLANLLLSLALGTGLQMPLQLSTFAWLKALVSGVGVAGISYWLAADQVLGSGEAKTQPRRWRLAVLALFASLFAWGLFGDSLAGAFVCIVVAALTLIVYLPSLAEWLWQSTLVPAAKRQWPTLRTLGVRQVLRSRELRLGVSALALALATALGISIMVDSFRSAFVTMLDQRLADDVVVQMKRPLVDSANSSTVDSNLAASRAVLTDRVAQHSESSYWRGDGDVSVLGVTGRIEYSNSDGELLARFFSQPQFHSKSKSDSQPLQDKVFINESFARQNNISVGEGIELLGARTTQTLTVAGVFRDFGEVRPRLLGSRELATSLNGRAALDELYVRSRELSELRASLEPWLDDASINWTDQAQVRKRSIEIFEQTFAITRALTWLALLVAAVALANALAAHGLQQQGTAKQLRVLGLDGSAQRRLRWARTGYVATVSVVLAVPLGLVIAALLCYAVNPRAFGWSFEMQLTPTGVGWPLLGGALGGLTAAALGDWLSRREDAAVARSQAFQSQRAVVRTSLVPLFVFLVVLLMTGCGERSGSDKRSEANVSTPSTPSLRVGNVLGGAAEGFARATEIVPFNFPADHGPHPKFRSEWWYLTCPLHREGNSASNDAGNDTSERSEKGAEFGVQFTLFRQGLIPSATGSGEAGELTDGWRTGQIYMAHAALTDVGNERHFEASRLARGHPQLAGVAASPFAAWLENWRLEADNGQGLEAMHLRVRSAEFFIDLALKAEKPIVLQGNQGLSYKGSNEASYYYSLPRLAASGAVQTFADSPNSEIAVAVAVAGACWLDREWSTSVLAENLAGWDWFALQFDDTTELMLFQLRDSGAANSAERMQGLAQGKSIDRDGRGTSLPQDQLSFKPLRYWDDETGARWPVEWEVATPDRKLRVVAALDDQKMRSSIEYWEGLVWVFENNHRVGQGYLEMTGYSK